MIVNPEISLGAVLIIATTIASSIAFIWAMRARLDVVDEKIGGLRKEIAEAKNDINALKTSFDDQVRSDMRLQQVENALMRLDRTVEDLRRGEGMIVPLGGKNKTAFGGT